MAAFGYPSVASPVSFGQSPQNFAPPQSQSNQISPSNFQPQHQQQFPNINNPSIHPSLTSNLNYVPYQQNQVAQQSQTFPGFIPINNMVQPTINVPPNISLQFPNNQIPQPIYPSPNNNHDQSLNFQMHPNQTMTPATVPFPTYHGAPMQNPYHVQFQQYDPIAHQGLGTPSTMAIDRLHSMGLVFPHGTLNEFQTAFPQNTSFPVYTNNVVPSTSQSQILHPTNVFQSKSATVRSPERNSIDIDKLEERLLRRLESNSIVRLSRHIEKLEQLYPTPNRNVLTPRPSRLFTSYNCSWESPSTSNNYFDRFLPEQKYVWDKSYGNWNAVDYVARPVNTSQFSSIFNSARASPRVNRFNYTDNKFRCCLEEEYHDAWNRKRFTHSSGPPICNDWPVFSPGLTTVNSPSASSDYHRLYSESGRQQRNLSKLNPAYNHLALHPFRMDEYKANRSLVDKIKGAFSSLIVGSSHPTQDKPDPNYPFVEDISDDEESKNEFIKFPKTKTRKARTKLTKPNGQFKNRCKVNLTRDKYYCIPSLDVLDSMTDDCGQCFVDNFEIGHYDHGRVVFEGKINVAGLDLDSSIYFDRKMVLIYPNRRLIPYPGTELNRPAIVTLHNFWPSEADAFPVSNDEMEKQFRARDIIDYAERLKDESERNGYEFVTFHSENGDYTFKISVWTNN